MKRIKLLGLALLALFALSAVASSVAAAEFPEILPVPTAGEPLKFTSKLKAGSVALLENEASTRLVACKEAKNNGEFTTQDHGKVTIEFKSCEELKNKIKCKSPGAAEGEIKLEGLIELVDLKSSPSLTLGLWLEPFASGSEEKNLLKFSCGVLSVEISGSLLAKVDNVPSLTKVTEALVLWHQTKGVQEEKTCELLKTLCSKGPFDLKAKFTSEGAAELSGQEAEAEIVFAKATEVHY